MGDNDSWLRPGEVVRWRGRPRRVLFTQARELGAAAVLLAVLAAFALPGAPWVLPVAAVAPAGLVLARAWLLRGTEYVVTDQRTLAVWRGHVRARAHLRQRQPELASLRPDGSGTLRFSRRQHLRPQHTGQPLWISGREVPLVLWEIAEVEAVAELIARRGPDPEPSWHYRVGRD